MAIEDDARRLMQAYGEESDKAVKGETADMKKLVGAFADYFVGSSPAGVMGGTNDEKFQAMVPKGLEHYRAVGGKRMWIEDITVTKLDELHAIAAVDWVFDYTNKAGKSGDVRFRNLYFVTNAEGRPKIFAWITPDEEKAMREHGLA